MKLFKHRPYIQKWWIDKGDRYLGARVVKYGHESFPTIDIYWWWGGVMIYFASRH